MVDTTYYNITTIMDLLTRFDNGSYNPERYIKYVNDLHGARKQSSISENSISDRLMLWGSEVIIDKDKEINKILTDHIFTTVVDFFNQKYIYKIGDITEESLVELMFATNIGMKRFLPLLYILFTGENRLEYENRSKEEQDEISRKIVASEIMENGISDTTTVEEKTKIMNDIEVNKEYEANSEENNEEYVIDNNESLSDEISEQEYEVVSPQNNEETLKSNGEFKDIVDTMSSYILDLYSQSISEVENTKMLNFDLNKEISENQKEYKIMTEEYSSEIDTLREMIIEKDKLIKDQSERINSIRGELEENNCGHKIEIQALQEEIHNLKRSIEDFSSIKGMVENILKRFKA